MIDLVGFAASALIIGSAMTRSIGRLRGLAIVGAVAYITYGVLLPAWPVVVTNTVTLTIHLIHLRTLLGEREPDAPVLAVVKVVPSEHGRERVGVRGDDGGSRCATSGR